MTRLLHKLIAVLMLAGLAGFLPALAASPAQAIVGGTPVTNNDLAFMAQINDSSPGGKSCSGTLIHPSWVLTAAHCVIPTTSVGNITARIGNTRRDVGGDVRRVSRIVRNPSNTSTIDTSGFHDEALLQLSSPVTDVTPIKLGMPSETYLWDGVGSGSTFGSGDQGLAAGWGAVARNGAAPSQLQYASVNITAPITDPAGSGARQLTTDRGVCPGDSGGPLLVYDNGTVVEAGVLSGSWCDMAGQNSGGNYNEVGAGPDRTWVMSHETNLFYTSFGTADWNGDGYQDVIARQDSTGQLWLYPGQGVPWTSTATRVPLGTGWKGFTPFGVADWNNDGHPDVIARDDATGNLYAYPGQGGLLPYGTRHQLAGSNWSEYAPFGVADWDGNGTQDLLARDSYGTLWLCPGSGSRTFDGLVYPQYSLGGGWNKYSPFGVADWDHYDEHGYHPDIVARDNDTGDLWLYPGDGGHAMSATPRAKIGNGWSGYSSFGLADWDTQRDTNHHMDILAREDTTGYLWLYPGQGLRSMSTDPRAQIGNGW